MIDNCLTLLAMALLMPIGCSGATAQSPSPPARDAEVPIDGGPCSAASREVTVDNAFGTMHGTLQTPDGCGPFPVVIIVPGSGAIDRDCNTADPRFHPDSYRLLAAGLADRGLASIRYDKGGFFASAGAAPASEADFRFEMEAHNAALWVSIVRADARFGRVAFAGHSEGALLAMLAAKEQQVDGYASLEGAGRPIGAVLREQVARFNPELLAQASTIIDQLEKGQTVADVPTELQFLFRSSGQPYLISWMKYDPQKEIASVDAPVLIVQGTTDIQVSVADANLLAAARSDATLAVIEGMNHVLKAATLDTASQTRAYSDPSLPIVEPLFTALVELLAQ